MNRILAILLCLVIIGLLKAEVIWFESFGGEDSEAARHCLQTAGGNLLLAGYTYSCGNGNADLYLLEIDPEGNLAWDSALGGPGWEYANAVCQCLDGSGYLIAGYTTSEGAGSKDFYLVKTTLTGNFLWSRTYGGANTDIATALCPSGDGNYILCGYSESYTNGEDDIYLIKVDSAGDTLWTRHYGTEKSEMAHSIITTSDGNLLICGSSGMFDNPGGTGRNRDIYLLKVDQDGIEIDTNVYWIMSSSQGGFDNGYQILEGSDGGFYIVGCSSAEGIELMNITLLKTDSQLEVDWKRNYEIAGFYDYGYGLSLSEDGERLVICGSYRTSAETNSNLFLKVLDIAGNEILTETWGGTGVESAFSVLIDAEENYLVAGSTSSLGGGSQDILVIKVSGLLPDFEVSLSSGHAPLSVNFTDLTIGNTLYWSWDFDNDGLADSEDQNPGWVYPDPGVYTISLTVSDPYFTKTIVKNDLINVFDGESALLFQSSDSYVNLGSSPELNLPSAFTVEAWIKPVDWGETTTFGGRIVDKSAWGMYLLENHNSLESHCLAAVLRTESCPLALVSTQDNSIALQEWQHVALSYNGIDEVNVFINGQAQDLTYFNQPTGELLDNSDMPLIIGRSSSLIQGFEGIIDEVRLWDYALNEMEIQSGMNALLAGSENGLLGYWQMNEGNGLLLEDASLNDNHGEITGASWIQGTPFQPTAVEGSEIDFPDQDDYGFLLDNSPNPFNPVTAISFQLPDNCQAAELTIHNIKGQLIRSYTLAPINHEPMNSSPHQLMNSITWDGLDRNGQAVCSGLYCCTISCAGKTSTRKMLLLK